MGTCGSIKPAVQGSEPPLANHGYQITPRDIQKILNHHTRSSKIVREAGRMLWIFHVFLENVHLANLLKSFLCMFVLWNLCTPVTFPLSDVAAPFSIDPTKCCCTHTLHWKFNPTQHGFPSVKQYHEKPIHEYLSMCSGS